MKHLPSCNMNRNRPANTLVPASPPNPGRRVKPLAAPPNPDRRTKHQALAPIPSSEGWPEGTGWVRSTAKRLVQVTLATLVGFLLLCACSNPAAAQSTCNDPALEAAAEAYDIGRFPQTFALLKPCLPNGFSGKTQQVDAYRLIALSYIATDSLEQARSSIRQLLNINSRFQPDGVNDLPLFANLVSDLKPKWYTWLWHGNAWYKWAGRGAIVGAASLPFLLKSTPEPDLPGNPIFPTGG